jgi:hypothetical protein
MMKSKRTTTLWLVLCLPLLIVGLLWTKAQANRPQAHPVETRALQVEALPAGIAQQKPSPVRLLSRSGSKGKTRTRSTYAKQQQPAVKPATIQK